MSDARAIRHLTGEETVVPFLPGDRFTGVEFDWLVDHLMLSPEFGRLSLSAYEDGPSLSCFLDDEEVNVLAETGEFPLGPGKDFEERVIARIGNDDPFEMSLVSATLYDATPWLMSVWLDVREDYLPVAVDEFGASLPESKIEQTWAWVIEMVQEWAQTGVEHDLSITSELLADALHTHSQLTEVANAAAGGRGTVTVNGAAVYTPEEAS